MDEFKQKYIEEANEVIASLENTILKLEGDRHNEQMVEEIFRSLHTLKGGAAMFGFESIKGIAHELENAFDQIRSGNGHATKALLDITLEGIDYFKNVLDENTQKGKEYEEQLVDRITKTREKLHSNENGEGESQKTEHTDSSSGLQESGKSENTALDTPESDQEPGQETEEASGARESTTLGEDESPEGDHTATYYIFFRPHKDILKNGTNPLLLINELTSFGQTRVVPVTSAVPELKKLVPDELYMSWHIILSTDKAGEDEIRDVFLFVEEDAQLIIQQISDTDVLNDSAVSGQLDELLRSPDEVDLSAIQRLVQEGVKPSVQETATEATAGAGDSNNEQPVYSTDEPPQLSSEPETKVKTSNEGKKRDSIASIRISSEKVDELMNLVSELVTTQARLNLYSETQSDGELEEINETIHKLTSQLRDNAFDLSLIPFQSIVTRFQRLVRDLSSQLGKEVHFVTEGTDTELDKTIIENLVDPILHLIRNSLDHGIEDEEERINAGKPKTGTISLKAYYSGANVHIEIKDDGRGIDMEAIRQKGIEKGLVSAQAQLTKKEILNLIFMPGFSTNQSITDLSGRGVGMDVVKDKISEIRGDIDIDSQQHKGTTITIKLPLTLSIVDGLLIGIGETKYVLPINIVHKIYPITYSDLEASFYDILVLDGEQIPYFYLRGEFEIDGEVPNDMQVVTVYNENQRVGLVVDQVIGEYQAVLQPLGKHYRKIQLFSGATILGDGTVALVMDTNKMISHFSSQEQEHEQAIIN